MSEPSVVAAFQRLQAGDAAGALSIARAVMAAQPRNARAALAAGLALRGLRRFDEARVALESAVALDPNDYAAAYELGLLHDQGGDADAALARFEDAVRLKPSFVPALYAAGVRRLARNDRDAARRHFEAVANLDPANPEAPRELGRLAVTRGDFGEAASRFAAAALRDPGDTALPIYLAQAELVRGQWKAGWAAYRRRDTRVAFEQERAREGKPYRVPAPGELAGRSLLVVAEQGLGDILFFLRFVPQLLAARVGFAGDARLHSILARTGLFDACFADRRAAAGYENELLIGDLPLVANGDATPPSLRAAPEGARVAQWRTRLEALGPHPWTGLTWRAGAADAAKKHGLAKNVPLAPLLEALVPNGGTLVALQRNPAAGELNAPAGLGFADLSSINDNLEDALAVLSLLDRHVGVSNTNMHLAALAGRTAQILVPFPPEWRWGVDGESPWYPGFEVFRQRPDGDWGPALAALARKA